MPAEILIAPEVELDIAEAYLWYERCRAGLGEEFLSSVDACLDVWKASGADPRPALSFTRATDAP